VRAQPQRADLLVGDAQLERGDARRADLQRRLVGGRPGRHRQDGAAAVGQDQARLDRARRRAHDLREAGARLHGVGDGLQRAEIEPGRRVLGRRGHGRIVRRQTLAHRARRA
jgi:hypothetical protein